MTMLVDVVLKFIEESDIIKLKTRGRFQCFYKIILKRNRLFSKSLVAIVHENGCVASTLKIGDVDIHDILTARERIHIGKALLEKLNKKKESDNNKKERKLIKLLS